MKKVSVIWIDREHAQIFHFSDISMERRKIRSSHHDHHTHARDNFDHERQERSFFQEAKDELAASSHIVLVGPGVAKHHFQTYLIEHYPVVARKIIGLETVDHPTDGQIAAMAKTYFDRAG